MFGDQWREEWKPDLNLASQAKEAELEPRCPINTETMAGALEVLEQIGMIKLTDRWKQARESDKTE